MQPPLTPSSASSPPASLSLFELVHDGGECGSCDTGLPTSASVEECAEHCKAADGCEFFSYNAGNGYCFHERTASRNCPEGFEVDGYSFYALLISNPSAASTASYQLEQHFSGEEPLNATFLDAAADTVAAAIGDGCFTDWPSFNTTPLTTIALATSVIPTSAEPIATSGLDWLLLKLQARAAETLPASELPALPAASDFPGALETGASPLSSASVQVDASYAGRDSNYLYSAAGKAVWRSTGLWAAAGEPITVHLPLVAVGLGLGVRIGSHSDQLYNKDAVERVPSGLSREYALDSASTIAASALGGLIYITVPGATDLGSITVTVFGAYAAPHFRLGVDTDADWNSGGLKERAAPFAEFESPTLVITVPTSYARTVSEPTALMLFWEEMMNASATLEGYPTGAPGGWARARPERFVMDRQISLGWMHSGYPIMGHVTGSEDLLVTTSKWGPFHELGHNFQWSPWLLPGTTEASVNLWSVYLNEKLGATSAHSALSDAARATRLEEYLETGPDFELWSVWTALETYLQLKEAFGWGFYMRVFAGYRSNPQMSYNNKIDEWAWRTAEVAGVDLSPFYLAWGFPLSDAVVAEMALMARWDADPMIPKPPLPPAAPSIFSGHVLVQEQKECDDDGETDHGYYLTLQECADECAATTGCVNFIYARIGAGRCSGTNCKCFTVRATDPLRPPLPQLLTHTSRAMRPASALRRTPHAHAIRRCREYALRLTTAAWARTGGHEWCGLPEHCEHVRLRPVPAVQRSVTTVPAARSVRRVPDRGGVPHGCNCRGAG